MQATPAVNASICQYAELIAEVIQKIVQNVVIYTLL